MTQDQKELLIKDLCARLPYGVKISVNDKVETLQGIDILDNVVEYDSFLSSDIEEVKPYLFPPSSMTEEQKRDLTNLFNCTVVITGWEIVFPNYYDSNMDNWNKVFNWCYKNHFDINGLIPMGLAIDCTTLNIY